MAEGYAIDAKVYATEDLKRLSMHDLLHYFEEHGAMKVSDLHIKVGTPVSYRVNGDLVKLKGLSVTTETAKRNCISSKMNITLTARIAWAGCSSASTSSGRTTGYARRYGRCRLTFRR
jgi:Tfp pilus assembly pilus retraction ATPase PilT